MNLYDVLSKRLCDEANVEAVTEGSFAGEKIEHGFVKTVSIVVLEQHVFVTLTEYADTKKTMSVSLDNNVAVGS